MMACEALDIWAQFLEHVKNRSSAAAFGNWLAPISLLEVTSEEVVLEIPNIFVKEYLLSNYKEELRAFLPVDASGELSIRFVVAAQSKAPVDTPPSLLLSEASAPPSGPVNFKLHLNPNYRFENFIEGPNNQFVKSAAIGIATRPGQSYNPLFIHGDVGGGKTHLLHSIGYFIISAHKRLRIQCITTEAFINNLVDNLRNKSIDQMKRFYRSDIDVLLVDDIQFLQNRLNFEEEFCNTFEALINQNKQIVIISDKPPAQLKLSERMIARMEWGLVAHMGMPELETRVAILQHKAQQKGLKLSDPVAFFIAEHIFNNVRQLEGAINRLSAHCRLLNMEITEELVQTVLKEMLQLVPKQRISVDQILNSVAAVFQERRTELKGPRRTKKLVLARQVAMYLACKLVHEPLQTLAGSFGKKTHSTLLHACKSIEEKLTADETLRRQIAMVQRHLTT